MRILVLGCNGMVGGVVALYLREQGHDVLGFDDELSPYVNSIAGDIFSVNALDYVVKSKCFDAIINCTAIINQDADAEKSKAVYINSYLPHFLEEHTAGTSTVVVHRSTDCIFSGKRGHYGPADIPDGESFYAKTKAVGELINEKDITIRTSLIGPETDVNGCGLLNWFLRQKGELNGFTGAIWTGLTTIEFAREIELLLQKHTHGLFQCVPNNAISKYDLLILFEKYFPGDRRILRVDTARVDKSLIPHTSGIELDIPDYEPMIAEMADWIGKHEQIYGHTKKYS